MFRPAQVIVMVGLLLGAGAAAADHEPKEGGEAGGMPAPMQVGDEHRVLHQCAGTWKTVSKMWFGPGEPVTSEGRQVCRVVLGGLGVSYEFTGKMGPNEFHGHGTTVWNPGRKKYESYWFDNFSFNGAAVSWGTYDPKTRTMTEEMTSKDPSGAEHKMKLVTRYESADKHVLTFYELEEGGKERRVMEITYTRVKE